MSPNVLLSIINQAFTCLSTPKGWSNIFEVVYVRVAVSSARWVVERWPHIFEASKSPDWMWMVVNQFSYAYDRLPSPQVMVKGWSQVFEGCFVFVALSSSHWFEQEQGKNKTRRSSFTFITGCERNYYKSTSVNMRYERKIMVDKL